MNEKLQKVLARAGFGSRREIETWIEQGRIRINQSIATIGDRVNEHDKICVDGSLISHQRLYSNKNRILIYNKDAGTVCSRSDPEGRNTIFKDLPKTRHARWISVGRLDITTMGLLIITTDGELANRLMHPSYEIPREYMARVLGEVDEAMIQSLMKGVELEDGLAHFDSIIEVGDRSGRGANHWYRVVIKEGRNREVRRLWESQGVRVSRLSRIRYGPVTLPRRLRRGHWCEMEPTEVSQLYKLVELENTTDHPRPQSAVKKLRQAGSRWPKVKTHKRN